MINALNGEYRSIAAKYDDFLGIMVISWSLVAYTFIINTSILKCAYLALELEKTNFIFEPT